MLLMFLGVALFDLFLLALFPFPFPPLLPFPFPFFFVGNSFRLKSFLKIIISIAVIGYL